MLLLHFRGLYDSECDHTSLNVCAYHAKLYLKHYICLIYKIHLYIQLQDYENEFSRLSCLLL